MNMNIDVIKSSADDIFELGMKYCLGIGVGQSNIEAQMV